MEHEEGSAGVLGFPRKPVCDVGWMPVFPVGKDFLEKNLARGEYSPGMRIYREYLAVCERIANSVGDVRVGGPSGCGRDDGVVGCVSCVGRAHRCDHFAVGIGAVGASSGQDVEVGIGDGRTVDSCGGCGDGSRSACQSGRNSASSSQPSLDGVSEDRQASVGAVAAESRARLGQLPRGPNYERNQENRLRKKAVKAAQRAGLTLAGREADAESVVVVEAPRPQAERVGIFSGLDEETQEKLVKTRAERLILENEARILELKEKAARRRSGLHHATEAVKVAKMADNWRKCADNDGPGQKVYGWARTIATTSSESIARDSPVNSLASLDSKISSKSSVSVADHTLTLGNLPMNGFEHYLSRYCGKSAGQLVNARRKFGSALRAEDCLANVKDSPVPQSQVINYLNEVIDDFAMRYERID